MFSSEKLTFEPNGFWQFYICVPNSWFAWELNTGLPFAVQMHDTSAGIVCMSATFAMFDGTWASWDSASPDFSLIS